MIKARKIILERVDDENYFQILSTIRRKLTAQLQEPFTILPEYLFFRVLRILQLSKHRLNVSWQPRLFEKLTKIIRFFIWPINFFRKKLFSNISFDKAHFQYVKKFSRLMPQEIFRQKRTLALYIFQIRFLLCNKWLPTQLIYFSLLRITSNIQVHFCKSCWY